jgi:hypothetical protein
MTHYTSGMAECKMSATQDAKKEILVEIGKCNDLGGRSWLMTRRPWTDEDS